MICSLFLYECHASAKEKLKINRDLEKRGGLSNDDTLLLTKEAKIIPRSCSTAFILYTYMNIHTHITQTNTQIFKGALYLQPSNNGFANKTCCAI